MTTPLPHLSRPLPHPKVWQDCRVCLQDPRAKDWDICSRPLHCPFPSPLPTGGSRPRWHHWREGLPGRKRRPGASGIACKYLGAMSSLGRATPGSPSPGFVAGQGPGRTNSASEVPECGSVLGSSFYSGEVFRPSASFPGLILVLQ